MSIGNINEINKNYWPALQALNEEIVLHLVFSWQDSIFPGVTVIGLAVRMKHLAEQRGILGKRDDGLMLRECALANVVPVILLVALIRFCVCAVTLQ